MKTSKKTFAFALSGITQLGTSVVVSFLLWILIAMWVKKTFNLGNFIMIIGIVLGVGSAVLSFYNFCKKANEITNKEEYHEE